MDSALALRPIAAAMWKAGLLFAVVGDDLIAYSKRLREGASDVVQLAVWGPSWHGFLRRVSMAFATGHPLIEDLVAAGITPERLGMVQAPGLPAVARAPFIRGGRNARR